MGLIELPQNALVYLDASPLIFSAEKIQPYWSLLQPVWQAAQKGEITLLGSELLLLEVLVKPIEVGDSILERTFRDLLAAREFDLVPISAAILEQVVKLHAQYHIKTPDAIHAATAVSTSCDLLLTNDTDFRRLTELPIIVLADLLPSTA